MSLTNVKAVTQELHDAIRLPNRFAIMRPDHEPYINYDGCYRNLSDSLDEAADPKGHGLSDDYYNNSNLSLAFHGDGAPMTFEALRDMAVFNTCMMDHKVPFNKFTGTERSKRWVSFLLSQQSPWRDLIEYIEELDPDYINTAGFIFKSIPDLPKKLTYNFALAIRYPWEMTRCYELFLRLCDAGVPEPTALYVSMNFNLNSKAETIDGPYDVQYPWCFLEASGLETAGRFILGKPADVSPKKSSVNPNNVQSLWGCNDPDAKAVLTKLIENERLSLSVLLKAVAERVEAQRQLIGA